MINSNAETVKLELLNGSLGGIVKCSCGLLEACIAYKFPKKEIKNCKNFPELHHLGVYLLFGKFEEQDKIYIGLTDKRPLIVRIKESVKKYDRWCEEVVVFTSSNKQNLHPTYTQYLESCLINTVNVETKEALANTQIPALPSTKLNDMEKFLKYINLVIELMGYKIFKGPPKKAKKYSKNLKPTVTLNNPELFIRQKDIHARGKRTSGFVVFAGSTIRKNTQVHPFSISEKNRIEYKHLIDANGKLTDDIFFSSITAAAKFVIDPDNNISGNNYWAEENGN